MAVFLLAFAGDNFLSHYLFQTFLGHLSTARWLYSPATVVELSLFLYFHLTLTLP